MEISVLLKSILNQIEEDSSNPSPNIMGSGVNYVFCRKSMHIESSSINSFMESKEYIMQEKNLV